MSRIIQPPHKGVDVVVSIGDNILGGQQNASLSRSMSPIDITNKINGEWKEQISGVRSWSLLCSGMFIKDDTAFAALEEAFNNGKSVNLKITDSNKGYEGKAIITSFPLSTVYNDTYSYRIMFSGVGKLNDSTEDSK